MAIIDSKTALRHFVPASTIVSALVAAWALLIVPARAQLSKGPITISADTFNAIAPPNSSKSQSVYRGHVVIHHGNIVIHGATATIYTKHGQIVRVHVTGNPVTFKQTPKKGHVIHGKAQQLMYYTAHNLVVLKVRAHLTRGGQSFSAATIHYYINEKKLEASSSKNQRVHAVFPPATHTGGN